MDLSDIDLSLSPDKKKNNLSSNTYVKEEVADLTDFNIKAPITEEIDEVSPR